MCADPLWLQENTRCCLSTPLTAALASDLCVPLQWLSGEVTGLEGKALLLVPALPSRVALDDPLKSMSRRPLCRSWFRGSQASVAENRPSLKSSDNDHTFSWPVLLRRQVWQELPCGLACARHRLFSQLADGASAFQKQKSSGPCWPRRPWSCSSSGPGPNPSHRAGVAWPAGGASAAGRALLSTFALCAGPCRGSRRP